jgi:hypothetical protein
MLLALIIQDTTSWYSEPIFTPAPLRNPTTNPTTTIVTLPESTSICCHVYFAIT